MLQSFFWRYHALEPADADARLHEVFELIVDHDWKPEQLASLKDFVLAASLPGIKINTSPTDFAPFESVQLISFDGKQWNRFGEIMGK